MKKWSEIKQATLDKLLMEEEEAQQQGYLAKFRRLANECLNIIANGVKPKISTFEPIVVLRKDIPAEYREHNDTLIRYKNTSDELSYMVPSETTIYKVSETEEYVLENNQFIPVSEDDVANDYRDYTIVEGSDFEFIYILDRDYRHRPLFIDDFRKKFKPAIVKVPSDFLSFADMEAYVDEIRNPDILYIDDKTIGLMLPGHYKIFYNGEWETINDYDVLHDTKLNIDNSVLNCLPTYMASQLLSQDDVQRSYTLKNEFELMLSRLDTTIFYEVGKYKSEGGWY